MDKAAIRGEVRERLRSFHSKEEERSSIVSSIKELDVYKRAGIVLLYSALDDEVDLCQLLEDKGKTFLFPYLDGESMYFAPPPLKKGRYGIPEPVIKKEYVYEKALMIAPARALSIKNERIGRGGGYYDRYIKENGKKLYTIGVCYSVQLFSSLPVEVDDQKLDMVISGGERTPAS